MSWIESHTSLDKHHKVIRLRLAMRWSKNETIGFLHRFWWTVMEVSPSGDITSLSSPEVMAEMLDMPVTAMAQALRVMEDPDPKLAFLDRKGGRLLVHDWLDYAGRYLNDSKFRRSPEKMEEIKRIHKADPLPPPVIVPSADNPPTVGDTSPHLTLPNQREDVPPPAGVAPKAKAKPKPEFAPDSVAYKAARFMWEYVQDWSPQAIEPTEAGYQAWARDCDLMFRKDGRTPDAFNELLDWIDTRKPSKDGFTWRKNVLCPATLRKRWSEGKFADFLPSALAQEEFR